MSWGHNKDASIWELKFKSNNLNNSNNFRSDILGSYKFTVLKEYFGLSNDKLLDFYPGL